MYEIVIDSSKIQEIPIVMPKHIELWDITPEQAMAIREFAANGTLFVRLDTPDGERLAVTRIWPDPHDMRRVTLYLA